MPIEVKTVSLSDYFSWIDSLIVPIFAIRGMKKVS
jgi:hypothetical protein